MSLINFTTIFETAVAGLTQVSPPMAFIHGSKALQNILADKVTTYPCVFLDSPRVGKITVRRVGGMNIEYKITYAVLDKAGLDDSADNIRSVLQEMGENALYIFSKVMNNFSVDDDIEATWTELEGVFDAHLTGWMVEFTIEQPSTAFVVC